MQITRITILLLLQKLQGHDAVIDGPIMYELAGLAAMASVISFEDILKTIFDLSRKTNEDEMAKAVSRLYFTFVWSCGGG